MNVFRLPGKKEPFTIWYKSLPDSNLRSIIRHTIAKLEKGKKLDCKPLDDGLFEIKIHYKIGYRIYYTILDDNSILILYGGDKSSTQQQEKDIAQAIEYLTFHKQVYGEFDHETI